MSLELDLGETPTVQHLNCVISKDSSLSPKLLICKIIM